MLNFTLDFVGPPVLTLTANSGFGSKQQLAQVAMANVSSLTGSWVSGGANINVSNPGNGALTFGTSLTSNVTGVYRVSATNRGGTTTLDINVNVSALDPPQLSLASNSGSGTASQSVGLNVTNGGTVTAAWLSGGGDITLTQNSNNQFTFSASSGSPTGTVRFTATNAAGSAVLDVPISLAATPAPAVSGPTSLNGTNRVSGTFTVSSGSTLKATLISSTQGMEMVQLSATTFQWSYWGGGMGVETWRITASNGQSSSYVDVKVSVYDDSYNGG